MSGVPFDPDNGILKSEATASQLSIIDQNVSEVREYIGRMTALQIMHIRASHDDPEQCHTPCTSPPIIALMDNLSEDAVRMALCVVICDAANLAIREQ